MNLADPHRLATRFLDVIEKDIVPLTRDHVVRGDKTFGAAILLKRDLSLVTAGTNEETVNPLHHGEISALNAYAELPMAQRPVPADCYFLATHEPCSLCLSAITWSGFDNFTHLFSYADTRDAFSIPHDLRILEQVFGVQDGAYQRSNAYWTAQSIAELIEAGPAEERGALDKQVARIAEIYRELSQIYQSGQGKLAIPLA